MKKIIPVIKVIPKIRDVAVKHTIKLTETTLIKTENANKFLTELLIYFYLYHKQLKRLFRVILNSGNFCVSVFKLDIKHYRLFLLPEPLWGWSLRFNRARFLLISEQ